MMYLLSFFGMLGVDFLYAEYTKAAADRRTAMACVTAGAMLIFNALVVSLYVANPWTMIAAAAGAVVGTYISMRYFK